MSADFKFGKRSLRMLDGVHPRLILVVSRGLLYSPVDFAITEGLRRHDRQEMLVRTGRSQTMNSKHLTGHAVDVMAVGDLNNDGITDHQDKSITWNPEWYGVIASSMYDAAAELGIKIRWGGDFKGFYDGPHFELLRTVV